MPKVPAEVTAQQYELKATFFANRLEGLEIIGLFEFAFSNLRKISATLDWDNRAEFAIREDAYAKLIAAGKDPSLYFCHPNALLANGKFLVYFRCISVLSQKGLKTISGVSALEKIETLKRQCTPEHALKLTTTINTILSGLYGVSLPSDEKMKGIMYATAGASIDGSWRNAIGAEGERIVRSLLMIKCLEENELKAVTLKTGETIEAETIDAKWLDAKTAEVQSASFTNGSTALFASEPDITIVSPDGKTAAGVEIKAGLDPAGALERHGAMLKSFDKILGVAPNAETILIAACITEEVASRLQATKDVSRTYILTDIINNNGGKRDQFTTVLRGLAGLISVRR
ncbi:MAG: XcyI family restriction endonuclease [Sulfitobacter sp.]